PVAERAVHTPLTGPERRTLVVLLLTTTLWLTDAWHGLNPSIPALLAALLLVAPGIGVFGWKDLEARLSWELILTVGASLSLASVRRFGFVMLRLTLVVILGVAIPYWKLIGLPLVATR